jgi:hypothetical protein
MKMKWGSGGIVPRILNLGTRWRCQFHSLAALPPGKEARYPLHRSPQSQSVGGGREKKILAPCRDSNPGRSARCLVTILSYSRPHFNHTQLKMAFLAAYNLSMPSTDSGFSFTKCHYLVVESPAWENVPGKHTDFPKVNAVKGTPDLNITAGQLNILIQCFSVFSMWRHNTTVLHLTTHQITYYLDICPFTIESMHYFSNAITFVWLWNPNTETED